MASGSSGGGSGTSGKAGTGKPSSARSRALTRAKTSSRGVRSAPRSREAEF